MRGPRLPSLRLVGARFGHCSSDRCALQSARFSYVGRCAGLLFIDLVSLFALRSTFCFPRTLSSSLAPSSLVFTLPYLHSRVFSLCCFLTSCLHFFLADSSNLVYVYILSSFLSHYHHLAIPRILSPFLPPCSVALSLRFILPSSLSLPVFIPRSTSFSIPSILSPSLFALLTPFLPSSLSPYFTPSLPVTSHPTLPPFLPPFLSLPLTRSRSF